MAYENLKSAIKQVIKQNGNQEITGDIMQNTLLNIVNTLGDELGDLSNKENDIANGFRHVDFPKDDITKVLLSRDIKKGEAFVFLVRNLVINAIDDNKDSFIAFTLQDASGSILESNFILYVYKSLNTGNWRKEGIFNNNHDGPLHLYIGTSATSNLASLSFDVKIEILDDSVYKTITDHPSLMRGLNPMSLNYLRNSFFNLEDNLILKSDLGNTHFVTERDKVLMPFSGNYLALKSIDGRTATPRFFITIKEEGTYSFYFEVYSDVKTNFAVIGCGLSEVIAVNSGYSVVNKTYKLTSIGNLEVHMEVRQKLKLGFVYVGLEASINTALLSCANMDLKSLSARSGLSLGTIRNIEKFSVSSNQISSVVPGSPSVVGYREPVDLNSDLVLNGCLLGASGTDTVKAIVGQIDQRGWLIVRKQYEGKALSSVASNVIFFSFENAIIKKGESVYFDLGGAYWKYATDNVNTDMPLSWTDSNYLVTATRVDVNITRYELFVSDLDKAFALQDDLLDAQNRISSAEANIEASKIYEDRVTGDSYKLSVYNGSLVVKPSKPKSILIIGNSFTVHGVNDYWYGIRGMASSVPELDFKSLLSSVIEKVSITSGVQFETGYSLDFNFASLYDSILQENFDLIILQIGENSSYKPEMTQCWENLIKYLRSKSVTSDIVQIIGWSTGDKLKAISDACANNNVPVLNCYNETYTGQLRAGDYVTGTSKDEFGIAKPVILTHPSDVGMTLIANRILVQLGQRELDIFKNITLNQADGGTISVAYNKWPTGGLVSVKCNSDSGKSISSLSVSGLSSGPVKRVNEYGTYYTFFMPDNDISITPVWV